ncbi:MAG: hypothetical protein J3Q66DRAFT_284437 [Benniella sp.]|nr:MAG: hypothetical protein J3Q66DRAFT_284437 [Benniella sp.]
MTHRHHIGPMIQCSRCKAYFWIDERLSNSSEKHHSFSICGQDGRIVLPELRTIPRLLELMSGDTEESKELRFKLRLCNSALSFTSMGVKYDKGLANAKQGVYTFRINGAVVHKMGSLQAPEDEDPKFAQIYFLAPEHQVARRNEIFDDALDENLLLELQQLLDQVNPYCKVYKSIEGREYDQQTSELKIALKARFEVNGSRQRQYDLLAAMEVGVLIPGETTSRRIQGRSSSKIERPDCKGCTRHMPRRPAGFVLRRAPTHAAAIPGLDGNCGTLWEVGPIHNFHLQPQMA